MLIYLCSVRGCALSIELINYDKTVWATGQWTFLSVPAQPETVFGNSAVTSSTSCV